MKKLLACALIMLLVTFLGGCAKKCYTCGKPLTDGGYTAFGNDYCSKCILDDLGMNKTEENNGSQFLNSIKNNKVGIALVGALILFVGCMVFEYYCY